MGMVSVILRRFMGVDLPTSYCLLQGLEYERRGSDVAAARI